VVVIGPGFGGEGWLIVLQGRRTFVAHPEPGESS
jgi:hypothetical protein